MRLSYVFEKRRVKLLPGALALLALTGAEAQTRIDLRTQATGADIVGHMANTASPHTADGVAADSKQGTGTKFQMSEDSPKPTGSIAIYDTAGNVIAGACWATSAGLACGDGTRMSAIELPELAANGDKAFVLHGAAEQEVDGCIVLSGQPSHGQVLRATNDTLVDDAGRTCVVMEWAAGEGGGAFPALHGASHQSGGTDEIATATAAPNAIPKAGANGKLAAGWLPPAGTTDIGGVQAKDCAGTGAVGAINTDGSVTCAAVAAGTLGGDLSGTTANATVLKVNGVSFGAAPAVNTVPIVTEAGKTAYVPIPDCRDTGGQHLNYNASTHSLECGSGSAGPAPAATFWISQNTWDRNGGLVLGGPNATRGTGVYFPYAVSASRVVVHVQTADSQPCNGTDNCYSVGFYDTATGNLVAHTGVTSMNAVGLLTLPFLEGNVTIGPGWYLLAFTGTATGARIGMASNAGYIVPAQWANTALPNSSQGLLPASVPVPPMTSMTLGSVAFVGVY